MKITAYIHENKEQEIDIDFPVFRKQELDNSTIFMRIDSPKQELSIHLHQNKIEIEIDQPSFYSSMDYLLGTGEFQSSESEFNEAIKKSKDFISGIL